MPSLFLSNAVGADTYLMTPQALLAPARLARKPILTTQSDERLVDLVRAGYEPAFEAIVARYRGPLVGYCRRFLPESRAEDVVQQSFLNAYGAMKEGRGELHLRAWLYRIAHNTALNALRDRGLRHEQLHERLDGVERPDQALERSQSLRETLAAVQALPARQRDALLLRELEGRSYDEIASALGVSGGAVRQLLNRARTTLREGATALTPVGLILRLPWRESGEPLAARMAEACGTGAGVVAVKLCTTALVTGALIGGVAALPRHHGSARKDSAAKASRDASPRMSRAADTGVPVEPRSGVDGSRRLSENLSSDSVRGEAESGDDRSGTSGDDGHSGPGGGDDHSGTSGSSVSGSGDSGTSGSGSDSGHSGSDDSTTTSGSGSGGSGSSGSGSGDSGSSGSGETTTTTDGSSGSDSSDGSGSGDTLTTSTSGDGH